MQQKTIYISGTFAGVPEEVTKKFETAASRLIAEGNLVINPLTLFDHAVDSRQVIRQRLTEMFKADELYLLVDWNKSWASMIERNVATAVQMPIVYEPIPNAERPAQEYEKDTHHL